MRHHAGQNFYRIGLLALGGEARLSGPAAIEIVLDVFDRERQQRRTAIDHATDRDPMALAEGRDPEHVAEGVEGHFGQSAWLLKVRSHADCRNAGDSAGQTSRSSCPALCRASTSFCRKVKTWLAGTSLDEPGH